MTSNSTKLVKSIFKTISLHYTYLSPVQKAHDMELYDTLGLIPVRNEKVDRANYEARLVEDRQGRGAVRVMQMVNPADTDWKVKFKDPIPVKGW